MIEIFSFATEVAGPRLLVLGSVHGDETCGTVAIRRVIDEIETGFTKLITGRVTFAPICNPEAHKRNVRFIDRNLNRFLVPTENPTCYEARLGNVLCPLLADCDILLDLHSYKKGGEAFIFVGSPNSPENDYASILGPRTLMTGWQAAYAASGGAKDSKKDPDESTGTTEYSRRFGAISVTLECGDHKDSASIEVAYRAIHNALRFAGLVAGDVQKRASRLVIVQRVYYRLDDGKMAHDWKHLNPVTKGDLLATRADGEKLLAPEDGFMVLPDEDCALGAEWFYFGTESKF